MNISREQVEDFLYYEHELLDQWRLEEWVDLFTEDGKYLIPTLDYPHAKHNTTLFLVADDHQRLVSRTKRLLKKEAHVEYPHSKDSHLISNVRIREVKNEIAFVTCKFITYRTKREVLDNYVGHHEYQLLCMNTGFKILEKRVILDLDTLRPQGKISIIL